MAIVRNKSKVNHFSVMAKDLNDTIRKDFYPNVKKRHLFRDGYMSSFMFLVMSRSTVDLTIIDGNTNEPLDMGSPYDFGKQSWAEHPDSQRNKIYQLLQKTISMLKT
jgi:D-alanyl-D-alanine dipeptidase